MPVATPGFDPENPDEIMPGTPELLRIPDRIYRIMVQNGYSGSRYVYENEIDALYRQYNVSGNNTTGDDDVDIIITGGSPSGYDTGPSPADLRNLRASFIYQLQAWGLDLTKNLNNLVQKGVNQEWSTTNFILQLRQTREYKQAFAGIQKGQTEEAYMYAYGQFRDKLKDVLKRDLTREAFGVLQKKGVDFEEWSKRVIAIDRIKRDRDLFETFGEVLKQRGLTKGKFTFKDAYDFVTGKGSPLYEKVWEEAAFTTGLESAGFIVGKKGSITRQEMLKALNSFEGRNPGLEVEDLGDEFYTDLANKVRTLLPASRLAKFGLTETDILELQVGGPRAEHLAETVNQILANVERIKAGPTAKTQAQSAQGAIAVAGLEDERAQTL
jgi:hypothetical protein